MCTNSKLCYICIYTSLEHCCQYFRPSIGVIGLVTIQTKTIWQQKELLRHQTLGKLTERDIIEEGLGSCTWVDGKAKLAREQVRLVTLFICSS